jgi:hypothetical protein
VKTEVLTRAAAVPGLSTRGPEIGGAVGSGQIGNVIARLPAPARQAVGTIPGQIIVDGRFLAARTTFSGDFTGVFTYSPIGPVQPTGHHLEWERIGTFRYDDDGKLAEEWVQTDYRSFLTKLGVTTTESAQQES